MSSTKKPVRVLHISTHHESCGIGKYQEAYLAYMADYPEVHNEFYPLSLNKIKVLSGAELSDEMAKIHDAATHFDIVHIQHEFGLFRDRGAGLDDIMDAVGDVPTIVTIHTAPSLLLVDERLHGLHPRSFVDVLRRRRANVRTKKSKFAPLKRANRIITLNSHTRNQLEKIVGVSPQNITQTMIPIHDGITHDKPRTIRKMMKAKDDDIIICTVGFIHEFKGVDHAIRALSELPKQYKLAILGGTNPDSGNPHVLEAMRDLIKKLNLENRVYITGFIESDDELSGLIRGCDIALYPYSLEYYKLASSDAINRALMNHVAVIAYPTESFKELAQNSNGAILITKEATSDSLVRSILNLDADSLVRRADTFVASNSFDSAAKKLIKTYKTML